MQRNVGGRGRSIEVGLLLFLVYPHLPIQAVGRVMHEWKQGFYGHTPGWLPVVVLGSPSIQNCVTCDCHFAEFLHHLIMANWPHFAGARKLSADTSVACCDWVDAEEPLRTLDLLA